MKTTTILQDAEAIKRLADSIKEPPYSLHARGRCSHCGEPTEGSACDLCLEYWTGGVSRDD